MALESALKRDRVIVLFALTALAAVAWIYMLEEARGMEATGVCSCMGMAMSGPDAGRWPASQILPLFLMWAEMMVAMMIPSAAPMLLTFAMINRKKREQHQPFVSTGLFLLGYLVVWTVFSLAAAVAQWALHGAALLSPGMKSTSHGFGGALLIFVGIFQWTPYKRACLDHCRTPLQFLMSDWREGKAGAVIMGLKHGAYCTGCCWLLMCLLFVVGVMSIFWIAVVTIFVLVEKVARFGPRCAHVSGLLFVAWGLWVIAAHSLTH